jgi:hypothetical protein
MSKIGRWIAESYFTALWFLGFKDIDNDPTTPDDREKITWMLRRSKERIGHIWWVLSLGTLYLTFYWLLRTWGTWMMAASLAVFLFFAWLWPHVLESPSTGPSAALRQRFVDGRMRRRFDVA